MNDRRSNNTTGSAEPITGRANSAEPMMGRANSAEPNTVRSNKMAGPADASQISGGQTDYARISVGLNKGSEYAQIRVGSNNTGSADASQISGGSDKTRDNARTLYNLAEDQKYADAKVGKFYFE